MAGLCEADHPTPVQLFDFLAGRIDSRDECDRIETHLDQCTICQEVALRQPISSLEIAIGSLANQPTANSLKLAAPFELCEELGRGGSCIVYRAVHPSLDRSVALKMLLGGAKAHPRVLARFRREAISLAKLRHPAIVAIFDSGEQDGVPYLAMEWIDGKTLAEVLRQGPLDVDVAADLVRRLAEAIQHAHEQNTLHRDLKPQNVLLQAATEEPRLNDFPLKSKWLPKLIDFGLARFDPEQDPYQTCSGEFLGTPEYMSPEMILASPSKATASIDIYGLGAILYECLTGRPPFQGSSVAEVSQRILNDPPVPIRVLRPQVPRDLETICLRCLAKNPADRFASASAVGDDLRRYLAREPIASQPPSWPKLLSSWCRRSPWRAAAVLAITGLLTLIPLAIGYHWIQLDRQARLASENYEATRKSLWRVLDHVQKNSNSDVPKVLEISLAQVEEALDLFERLHREDPSPRATLDLSKAHQLVGKLSIMLSKQEQAAGHLNRSIELSKRLVENPAYRDEAQEQIVSSISNLSVTMILANANAALEQQKFAVDLQQELVDRHPDDDVHLGNLGWVEHTLASLYQASQHFPEAIAHYRTAISIRSKVEEKGFDREVISRAIAGSLTNLALAEFQSGDHENAETHYREALRRFDQLRENNSILYGEATMLGDWSATILNLATLIGNSGNVSEATDLCTRAIDALVPAHKREPQFAAIRDNLFKILATRAQLHSSQSRNIESAQDWSDAMSYTTDPHWKRVLPIYRISHLAQSARYNEAVSAAESFLRDDNGWDELELTAKWLLLSTWALAAESANQDATLSEETRKSIVDKNVTRSVGLLAEHSELLSGLPNLAQELELSHWVLVKSETTPESWEKLGLPK